MATQSQLAVRILHKLKVLDPVETANANDEAKALEKLKAAHYSLKVEGVVRWTLADVPDYAEEALVLCGAYLAADDFSQVANPDWFAQGLRICQRGAYVPLVDEYPAESY